MEKSIINGKQFDEERALYHLTCADVVNCIFAGEADGESVLKEAKSINVDGCRFSLRYPMWHVDGFTLKNSAMDYLTRAALWYTENGEITDCKLEGIKAVRECNNITIKNCDINSAEFGWKSENITLKDSRISSEYLFFDSKNIRLDKVRMDGKYSFQYIENLEISDSVLNTKDAFWHSKNVTVKNSRVSGEYLGWFSDGLTLINCDICGTQPLCYCKNLTLINCTMKDGDLSFEYSDVNADIRGYIDSVKNPKSGEIKCDAVGEIIMENAAYECLGKVTLKNN